MLRRIAVAPQSVWRLTAMLAREHAIRILQLTDLVQERAHLYPEPLSGVREFALEIFLLGDFAFELHLELPALLARVVALPRQLVSPSCKRCCVLPSLGCFLSALALGDHQTQAEVVGVLQGVQSGC